MLKRYLRGEASHKKTVMWYNMFFTLKILLILCIQGINCESTWKSFPKQYLLPEDTGPTAVDLEYYIKSLKKTVNYFSRELRLNNDTEVNRGFGMFFMKAILKRTILDHKEKLTKTNYEILKDIIKTSDHYISHYIYLLQYIHRNHKLEYQMSRTFKDDAVQVYSIGKFNRGRMQKWIMNNITMHPFIEAMDNLTLSRENYAYIVQDTFLNADVSDDCLSRVVLNREPTDFSKLEPCRPDPFCKEFMTTRPSVAYSLSHRLLNALLSRHIRRCYIESEKEDDDFMDTLCSFMYREAVYIARRGYFSRDTFLEHVALCGLFGYEEFFRHQWFKKSASWIDDQGCINEAHNFLIHRSHYFKSRETNLKKHQKLVKKLKLLLLQDCHSHPMALLLVVLAHAIRHTLNFMQV